MRDSENFLKKLILPLVLLTAFCLFSIPAFAAESHVVAGVDSDVYRAYAENLFIDDLENETVMRCVPLENMLSATFYNTNPLKPYTAFSGTECVLCETMPPADGDKAYSATVSVTSEATIRKSRAVCLGYVIDLPETFSDGTAAEFNVTATLISPRGELSLKNRVRGGVWTAVFNDISSWIGRLAINGIMFSVSGVNAPAAESYMFAIDDIALFDSVSVYQAMQWLVAKENWHEVPSTPSSHGMRYAPAGDSFYIETYASAAVSSITSTADCLCVRVDNRCRAEKLTMFYTTPSDPVFSPDNNKSEQKLYDGDQNVYFPLPADGCSQLRFQFDGIKPQTDDGYLEIISVYPTSKAGYQLSEKPLDAELSCRLDEEGLVTVTGTLSGSVAEDYNGCGIHLIQSSALQEYDRNDIIDSDYVLNDKFTLKGRGNTGFIEDRYAVVIEKGGEYIPVGKKYIYISNPEAACDAPGSFTGSSSIKGIISSDEPEQALTDAGRVYFDGASAVLIPLRIERLFTNKTSLYSINHNGTITYFDPSYVQQIDEIISAYRNLGTAVWLRLTVSLTDDAKINSLLCPMSSIMDKEYSAFNMGTRSGLSLYQSIFSFIAGRWSKNTDSPVSGYIIGSRVNDSLENWSLGNVTLDDFARSYAMTVRQAYLAMRAAAGSVRVAISVDGAYEDGYPTDMPYAFPTQAFITAFDRIISSEGSFDWMIELSLDADDLTYVGDPEAQPSGSAGGGSIEISINNFDVIDSFLDREQLKYRNAKRNMIVTAEGQVTETDFVYSYYCLDTIFRDRTGMFLISGSSANSFRQVFNGIDTSGTKSVSETSRKALGIDEWNTAISDFDFKSVGKRVWKRRTLSSKIPNDIKGRYEISNFGSKDVTENIKSGPGCTGIEWQQEFSGRSGAIKAGFSMPDGRSVGGIIYRFEYPIDLSASPVITFDCAVESLPKNTDQVQLNIMLISESADTPVDITIMGQLSRNGWQSAICDLTSMTKSLESIDAIRILISSYDGDPLGSPSLIIDNFTVCSAARDNNDLAEYFRKQFEARMPPKQPLPWSFLIIPGAVILICLFALYARFIKRSDAATGEADNKHNEWKYD
ncbi:MAG: hypothetical protein K6D94_10385 [Clostridiales bacterium]|nr:hypothetical protein [Clostridiales bacterium]